MKTSDEEPDSASAMLEDSKPDGPKVPIIVKTSIIIKKALGGYDL